MAAEKYPARRLAATALLPLALLVAAVPPAAAHCDFTQGDIVRVGSVAVTRCMVHQVLEGGVDEVNAQLDGQVAFVLLKDFRFHPEVVRIRGGGTVVWVWGDVHGNEGHNPRSSSTCGSTALDLALCNPNLPLRWGACFNQLPDQGGQALMEDAGDTYSETFRFNSATARIEESNGVLSGTPVVGEPPLAEPFRRCPADTITPAAGDQVLPYHCGMHGTPNGGNGSDGRMRGVVIVEA